MNLVVFGILCGILLSWLELQGLRRNAEKLLNLQSGKGWALLFVFRYAALALTFWMFLEIFKADIFPFVLAFIISHFILRQWYGRKIYA